MWHQDGKIYIFRERTTPKSVGVIYVEDSMTVVMLRYFNLDQNDASNVAMSVSISVAKSEKQN